MLSVIIPVYNEQRTLGQILVAAATALSSVPKQIIVVDDCSTDGTREWLKANFEAEGTECGEVHIADDGNMVFSPADGANGAAVHFKVLYHDKNKGKGGALRTRRVVGKLSVHVPDIAGIASWGFVAGRQPPKKRPVTDLARHCPRVP